MGNAAFSSSRIALVRARAAQRYHGWSSTFLLMNCVSGITENLLIQPIQILRRLVSLRNSSKFTPSDVSVWQTANSSHNVHPWWRRELNEITPSFQQISGEQSWVRVEATWTDNAFFRESWEFPCWVSQYVNWVSYYKEDSIEAWFNNLSNDRFVDSRFYQQDQDEFHLPGLWAPALITTRSASAQSSYLAA